MLNGPAVTHLAPSYKPFLVRSEINAIIETISSGFCVKFFLANRGRLKVKLAWQICLILLKCLIFILDTRNKVLKMPNDQLRFIKIKWKVKFKLKRNWETSKFGRIRQIRRSISSKFSHWELQWSLLVTSAGHRLKNVTQKCPLGSMGFNCIGIYYNFSELHLWSGNPLVK